MKRNHLLAAAVAVSTLFAGAAFADPYHPAAPAHGAAPVHAATPVPGAPGYAPPAYGAVPVATTHGDRRGDEDRAWREFQRSQAERAQREAAQLARERADFTRKWGWNAQKMAAFDQHQAAEQSEFARAQAEREASFRTQLAMNQRGPRGHRDRWD